MSGPKLTDAELLQLAKSWFAEAREQTAQEEAEFQAWNKHRSKFLQGVGGLLPSGESGGDGGGSDGGSAGDCGGN